MVQRNKNESNRFEPLPCRGFFYDQYPPQLKINRLNSKRPYSLRKSDKLKSRTIIRQLFSNGQTMVLPPVKLCYSMKNPMTDLQAGFSVSSRQFSRAVDRNRIKRLMREAYRLQKLSLANCLAQHQCRLSVFFIYIGKEKPAFESLVPVFQKIIQRLEIRIHENH
ncbi:MAG: ribonuclease P protein component [Ferruginibacter sp.]